MRDPDTRLLSIQSVKSVKVVVVAAQALHAPKGTIRPFPFQSVSSVAVLPLGHQSKLR